MVRPMPQAPEASQPQRRAVAAASRAPVAIDRHAELTYGGITKRLRSIDAGSRPRPRPTQGRLLLTKSPGAAIEEDVDWLNHPDPEKRAHAARLREACDRAMREGVPKVTRWPEEAKKPAAEKPHLQKGEPNVRYLWPASKPPPPLPTADPRVLRRLGEAGVSALQRHEFDQTFNFEQRPETHRFQRTINRTDGGSSYRIANPGRTVDERLVAMPPPRQVANEDHRLGPGTASSQGVHGHGQGQQVVEGDHHPEHGRRGVRNPPGTATPSVQGPRRLARARSQGTMGDHHGGGEIRRESDMSDMSFAGVVDGGANAEPARTTFDRQRSWRDDLPSYLKIVKRDPYRDL